MKGPSLQGPDATRLALDVLRAGGSMRLVAGGHSMTPSIRNGDRLLVEPLRRAPRIGDILACEIDGRLVIHRLVGRLGARLEVRGDVAPAGDGPLTLAHILGNVSRVERDDRKVRFGLGRERLLLAWLSRRGVLSVAARVRHRLRNVSSRSGIRLALPVSVGTEGAQP